MKNSQIAKNNMYKKLLAFFAVPANVAIWAGFTRLVDEIANFVGLNGDLDTAIQNQSKDTKGITTGKGDAFDSMVEKAVAMAFKAFVWAKDTNNDELQAVFDVQASDFDKETQQAGYNKVKNIRDGISANIGTMASVNLLPADVTELNGLIDDYEAVIQAPEVAIGQKEASTDAILVYFEDIDASLEVITRLILSEYSASHPLMVGEFKTQKHIDNLPTNHSGIRTHITDILTGQDIEGAVLSIPALNKTGVSDIYGIAEIIKAKSGDYHANVSKPGYQLHQFIVKITRGKIIEFEIALEPGSGPSGNTVVAEGDIAGGIIFNLDTSQINAGINSAIKIEITGGDLNIYAAELLDQQPGAVFWQVTNGTNVTKTLVEFAILIGADDNKKRVTLQNPGLTTVHYKLTFYNV